MSMHKQRAGYFQVLLQGLGGEGENPRFIPALIDQGMLGQIHYGEVDYYHGIGPWYGQYRWNTKKDAAGSSLLSAGCHALDALLLFMGNEVDAVQGDP